MGGVWMGRGEEGLMIGVANALVLNWLEGVRVEERVEERGEEVKEMEEEEVVVVVEEEEGNDEVDERGGGRGAILT